MSPPLAHSRGFALLGDLFLQGLTPRAREAWAQVPDAEALIAALAEEAAAEQYTRAFTLELAPFESAFLSHDGLVGGDIAASVRELRARCGLDPATDAPDHLGEELRWMSFLTGAAADAARDRMPAQAIHELERAVLDEHLLRWLPALVASLRAQSEPPPLLALAADLSLALAVHRRVELGGAPTPWSLAPLTPVLDDERAGLRRIAEHLAIPAQAGGCFCRSTLVGIGRAFELPAGFGARADLLEGLLRSAAHYGRVPELCAAVDAQVVAWDLEWGLLDQAGLAPLAAPWHARIAETRRLLERVAGGSPKPER